MNLYKKNRDALRKYHPHLDELVESLIIDEDRVKVLKSESGEPRVLYKKEDGKEVYIHSSIDPVKYATDAAELVGELGDEGILILFGFGLGYLAEEMLKRFEESHVLIIYEATPELFDAAMKEKDLTGLLKSERVKIFLGENPKNLGVIHGYYHLIYNGKFLVVKHHPSMSLNQDSYDKFLQIVTDENKIAFTQIATGVNRGREFINSDMENVPINLRKHGIKKIKDLYKGRPAVVVSAGPSLDKNYHLLKKVKGKAAIIATDAALATLLPCGIIPDMVLAVEPSIKTLHMFEDTPVLKSVPLVALTVFQTDILKFYPGPVFINNAIGNYPSSLFTGVMEDKGTVPVTGGSVAHFAFVIAEYIGCNTIVLIGQDLSFNRERFHSRGFADIIDMLELDKAFNQPDIFGDDVLTRGDLFAYKLYFERILKTFKGTAFNATEGGLPIDGAKNVRFEDFINEYCADLPEMDLTSIMSRLMDDEVAFNLDSILTIGRALRDRFKDIKQSSSRILKNISKLEKMKKRGEKDSPEFSMLLDKVEVLVEKVKDPSLNLLVGYNYKLEFYLERQDIKEIDGITDKWEKLDKQLERGKKYYKEIIETISAFNKKLEEMIAGLKYEEKVNANLEDENLEMSERYYRAGMIYKKTGISSQAVKYFEMLINKNGTGEMKPGTVTSFSASRTADIYLSLADMYIKQFRFYDAVEILDILSSHDDSQGEHKMTVSEKIEKLMNICRDKIEEWETRKIKMETVLHDAENHYGGPLESGYFYFRTEDYKRAEAGYRKAVEIYESAEQDGKENKLIEAYYGLAHTYMAVDDPEKTVEYLEKAIGLDPSNPLFYRDLGLIAYQNNNIGPAEIFLTKAIELAPEEAGLYKPLANLYLSLGEREKAVKLYENALEKNVDNPVMQEELAMIYKEAVAEV